MSTWSEGCGLTGLEVKPDSPVWLVVISTAKATREGAEMAYGQLAPPLGGLYDGNTDVRLYSEDPEHEFRRDLYRAITGSNAVGLFEHDDVPDDDTDGVWFLSHAAHEFMTELPHADESLGTVGRSGDKMVKKLRDLLKSYVATDNQAADVTAARAAYRSLRAEIPAGFPDYGSAAALQLATTNQQNLEHWLQAWQDSYSVHHAMYEARRAFVPHRRGGPERNGHKAVGELARFTRRKALAAGLV